MKEQKEFGQKLDNIEAKLSTVCLFLWSLEIEFRTQLVCEKSNVFFSGGTRSGENFTKSWKRLGPQWSGSAGKGLSEFHIHLASNEGSVVSNLSNKFFSMIFWLLLKRTLNAGRALKMRKCRKKFWSMWSTSSKSLSEKCFYKPVSAKIEWFIFKLFICFSVKSCLFDSL